MIIYVVSVADLVKWTPDGNHYFVVSNTTADLYSVEVYCLTVNSLALTTNIMSQLLKLITCLNILVLPL